MSENQASTINENVENQDKKDEDDLKSKKFTVTKLEVDDEALNVLETVEKTSQTNLDTFPDIDNYRNVLSLTGEAKSRPTLPELQNRSRLGSVIEIELEEKKRPDIYSSAILREVNDSSFQMIVPDVKKVKRNVDVVKFGWIKGVLIRCVLNIFGVMLFLRISWLVGQAGVGLMTLIIILATVVTLSTTLSMSAICTNGEIKAGGAYYLISRSLGPEFGGAIGIVYSFANAIGAAINVIGFAETIVAVLKNNNLSIIDGGINDIRVIGFVTTIFILCIALIGMTWEAKVQLVLLFILGLAFLNYIIGTFLPPTEAKRAKGFVGYSVSTFIDNFFPDFRDGEDFPHLFGVFFPSFTGILAGANISGNLKNPQKAIPKGTLLAIAITSSFYIIFSWTNGATVLREATGILPLIVNELKNDTLNESLTSVLNITSESFMTCKNMSCKHGLLHNYHVMEMVSVFGPIITAGIVAASLSSALASMVSAPKIFQAVCADKIFKKSEFFAKGHGKDNEPWRGYILCWLIATCFVGIGDINLIAPIISNFFLMSYALINYSVFDASLAKNPGWRPAFKYYNKWVSLFGALVCISVMFLIKWWGALFTILCIVTLHQYVKQTNPAINWGSSTQAQIFRKSLDFSLKLMDIEDHVKNFRPNFLVLTGQLMKRPALCDLIGAIARNRSLMVCANVKEANGDAKTLTSAAENEKYYSWLKKRKIKSFFTEINSNSLRLGVNALMQSVGVGKLKPNTLIIGFKNNWYTEKPESVLEYYEIINDAFQLQYGIGILRLEGGLDHSDLLGDTEALADCDDSKSIMSDSDNDSDIEVSKVSKLDKFTIFKETVLKKKDIETLISKKNKSNLNRFDEQGLSSSIINLDMSKEKPLQKQMKEENQNLIQNFANTNNLDPNNNFIFKSTDLIKLKNTKINQGVLQGLNMFHRKYQSGYLDVWWAYDDGGLTLLLPYLLSQKKYWEKCKLRIFIQKKNNNDTDISEEQRNIATLLAKFRIEFDDLIVFSTQDRKPKAASFLNYDQMIENWKLKPNESEEEFPWKISDTMYKQNYEKIVHFLRLKELLVEYSKDAAFIFITISVPTKQSTCAALYMSYLDYISLDMPPILMIRGNQKSVLTYYS